MPCTCTCLSLASDCAEKTVLLYVFNQFSTVTYIYEITWVICNERCLPFQLPYFSIVTPVIQGGFDVWEIYSYDHMLSTQARPLWLTPTNMDKSPSYKLHVKLQFSLPADRRCMNDLVLFKLPTLPWQLFSQGPNQTQPPPPLHLHCFVCTLDTCRS